MKCDIALAGVGGQGVLTVAAIISATAQRCGLNVKQAEVHGMAQRGGSVLATTRISDEPVASALISKGGADLLIGMEPLESLRYLDYLSTHGTLITTSEPVVNITDYPPLQSVKDKINSLPKSILVDATVIAKELGSVKSVNVVLVGAASGLLPLKQEVFEETIRWFFRGKDQKVQDANIAAFRAGKEAAR